MRKSNNRRTNDAKRPPSAEQPEAGAVIFHILPALPYGQRLAASLGLVLAGFAVQAYSGNLWYGLVLLFCGSGLMCVRGCNNLVETGSFKPGANWDKSGPERLDELLALDRKMCKWDRSFLDATNPLGAIPFALLVFLAIITLMDKNSQEVGAVSLFAWHWEALILDAATLLLPHWLTGLRRIHRLPKLLVKVKALKYVVEKSLPKDNSAEITLLTMLRGKKAKLPDDVKLQVRPANAPEGFMGLYVQVVVNLVQGTQYPYLYAVLVAKDGFGLKAVATKFIPPGGMIKEFKIQDGVEVLVIRQHTTKTSGYHTADKQAAAIVLAAWKVVLKL